MSELSRYRWWRKENRPDSPINKATISLWNGPAFFSYACLFIAAQISDGMTGEEQQSEAHEKQQGRTQWKCSALAPNDS